MLCAVISPSDPAWMHRIRASAYGLLAITRTVYVVLDLVVVTDGLGLQMSGLKIVR